MVGSTQHDPPRCYPRNNIHVESARRLPHLWPRRQPPPPARRHRRLFILHLPLGSRFDPGPVRSQAIPHGPGAAGGAHVRAGTGDYGRRGGARAHDRSGDWGEAVSSSRFGGLRAAVSCVGAGVRTMAPVRLRPLFDTGQFGVPLPLVFGERGSRAGRSGGGPGRREWCQSINGGGGTTRVRDAHDIERTECPAWVAIPHRWDASTCCLSQQRSSARRHKRRKPDGKEWIPCRKVPEEETGLGESWGNR
mmetsp:Transcript_44219/g.134644  ORF Transcript_44219/g.134644 Transcript_44219/m.134644 type:complete len:249 (-) Transcript_44219:300-1046(-)